MPHLKIVFDADVVEQDDQDDRDHMRLCQRWERCVAEANLYWAGERAAVDALQAKFLANSEPALGKDAARRTADLIWRIDALDDVRAITGACG